MWRQQNYRVYSFKCTLDPSISVIVDERSNIGLIGLVGAAIYAEPPEHLGEAGRHRPLARAGPLLGPGHGHAVVDHGVALVAVAEVAEVGGSAVAEAVMKRKEIF